MHLMIRGILWFGLYLFLTLLPLVTALVANPNRQPPSFLTAVAIGCGFVGFALMALEFALISRIKPAAGAFGEDSLQLFHNLMGTVALGMILAHPILLIVTGYPAGCWLNPFADCANTATRTAALSLYVLVALIATSIWRKQLRIRYEVWFVMHGIFALFVVFAALVHIFILGRYTAAPLVQGLWLLYALLVLGLIGWYRILAPIIGWNKQWEVVENRVELGDARTLILRPVGHKGFTFEPGQFAWLKLGRTPLGPGRHPISFSSNGDVPDDGQIAFTIKNLGDWSGKTVPALQPGATLWVDGPHGVFSLDREQAMGYVFIAGGVGITPLYSMCQTMASREDVRPVILFYGARNAASLTLRAELDALSTTMNLKVVYVLSEPDPGWTGEQGYITADVLERYLPKQYKRFKYLICGPDVLMDSMEKVLPAIGVSSDSVLTERFAMV